VRTINRFEKTSGRIHLKPEAIARLAHALGRPVDDFLELAAITLPGEKLKTLKDQNVFLGAPLSHAQRRLPVDFLHEVLTKMNGLPALLCVSVTSDRAIDNPDTNPIMMQLLRAGLWIAITSPYPNGGYIAAHRHRMPGLTRYYNSVFGRACSLANQLKRLVPERERQIAVMRLAPQPTGESEAPFRLAEVAISVTDNRPCIFYYPKNDKAETPSDVQIATYLRIGGARPDHWVISYPSEGSSDEQERAADTRDVWWDYFLDIISAWEGGRCDGRWGLDPKDLKRFWQLYEPDQQLGQEEPTPVDQR
jgi:hypothetical protein